MGKEVTSQCNCAMMKTRIARAAAISIQDLHTVQIFTTQMHAKMIIANFAWSRTFGTDTLVIVDSLTAQTEIIKENQRVNTELAPPPPTPARHLFATSGSKGRSSTASVRL